MSNEPELNLENNPLAQAILDAADDLEKGKPLGTEPDPLVPATPLDMLPTGPADEPQPPSEEEAKPDEPKRETIFSRLAKVSPFTWSLWIALACLTTVIVLLLLELQAYDWAVKAKR